MTADPVIELLGLSGSLRRGSYCTSVLRSLPDILPAGTTLTIFALDDIPAYNEDLDIDPGHPEVVRLRAAIAAADALVAISPEYNHGMSGVLKNAIDWASRPGNASCLRNKPVSIMTAATGIMGGVRAQAQLRETFASTASRVMANRQVVIGDVGRKIADGRLVDPATLDFIRAALGVLLDEVMLLRRAAPRAN